MNTDRSLGEFEQIVLLAALRLGDEAYGVTILAEIAAKASDANKGEEKVRDAGADS